MEIVRHFLLHMQYSSLTDTSAMVFDIARAPFLHGDVMHLRLMQFGTVVRYVKRLVGSPLPIIRDKNLGEDLGNSMIRTSLRHTTPPVSAEFHSPLGPAYRKEFDRH